MSIIRKSRVCLKRFFKTFNVKLLWFIISCGYYVPGSEIQIATKSSLPEYCMASIVTEIGNNLVWVSCGIIGSKWFSKHIILRNQIRPDVRLQKESCDLLLMFENNLWLCKTSTTICYINGLIMNYFTENESLVKDKLQQVFKIEWLLFGHEHWTPYCSKIMILRISILLLN